MLRGLIRPAFLVLFVCSLTVNVGLGAYAYLRDGGFRPWSILLSSSPAETTDSKRSAPIPLGALAPPIQAVTSSGAAIDLPLGTQPVVLYVLSPKCTWCARNTENIDALYRQRSEAYRFIGISVDKADLDVYLNKHPLPFAVYVAKEEMMVSYGLGTTPATIVIDKAGFVTRKFNGAYLRAKPAVEEFFKVKLPGVSEGGS